MTLHLMQKGTKLHQSPAKSDCVRTLAKCPRFRVSSTQGHKTAKPVIRNVIHKIAIDILGSLLCFNYFYIRWFNPPTPVSVHWTGVNVYQGTTILQHM